MSALHHSIPIDIIHVEQVAILIISMFPIVEPDSIRSLSQICELTLLTILFSQLLVDAERIRVH